MLVLGLLANFFSKVCSKSIVSCKQLRRRLTSIRPPSGLLILLSSIPLKSSLVPSQNVFASTSLTLQPGGNRPTCSSSYVFNILLNQLYLLPILSKLPASSFPLNTCLYSLNSVFTYQVINLALALSPNASMTRHASASMLLRNATSPFAKASSKSSHTCSSISLCNSATFRLNVAI